MWPCTLRLQSWHLVSARNFWLHLHSGRVTSVKWNGAQLIMNAWSYFTGELKWDRLTEHSEEWGCHLSSSVSFQFSSPWWSPDSSLLLISRRFSCSFNPRFILLAILLIFQVASLLASLGRTPKCLMGWLIDILYVQDKIISWHFSSWTTRKIFFKLVPVYDLFTSCPIFFVYQPKFNFQMSDLVQQLSHTNVSLD